MSFKVEAEFETVTATTNYTEQLDSIFNSLKEDIKNGMTNAKLIIALASGMDDLGSIFRGRKTIIQQYVGSKREEIEKIRACKNHRMCEVMNLFNCI